MEFFIDQYIMPYLPFEPDEETKKSIKHHASHVLAFADWMCGAHDPRLLVQGHASVVAVELFFTVVFFFTFVHAVRRGGRTFYTWLAILAFAITSEAMRVGVMDLEHRWFGFTTPGYAQSVLTWAGRRLPQFAICGKHHAIFYSAFITVERLHLPLYSEGPTVGLITLLFAVPYEVMGVKLLWWVWHDNDPNIYDRSYYVPWNEYQMYMASGCMLLWTLKCLRIALLKHEYDWKCFIREFVVSVLAGVLAPCLALMLFAPIYSVLHDSFNVSTEAIVGATIFVNLMLFWVSERNPSAVARHPSPQVDLLIMGIVVMYYAFFMFLISLADPGGIQAVGMWQPIGPCDRSHKITNGIGEKVQRASYLCTTRYDEKYFDFQCLSDRRPPPMRDGEPIEWYSICGTRFDNEFEYLFVIWTSCAFGLIFSLNVLLFSGDPPVVPIVSYKRKKE